MSIKTICHSWHGYIVTFFVFFISDKWKIDKNEITLVREVGAGQFGVGLAINQTCMHLYYYHEKKINCNR